MGLGELGKAGVKVICEYDVNDSRWLQIILECK